HSRRRGPRAGDHPELLPGRPQPRDWPDGAGSAEVRADRHARGRDPAQAQEGTLMLRFGTVTIAEPWREPVRSQETPYARRDSHVRTFDATGAPGEVITDMGGDLSRTIRIASGETVGFLTTTEKDGLLALYEAGEAFELEWDRLSGPGY